MNIDKIINEIIETDEAKVFFRWAIRPLVEGDSGDDLRDLRDAAEATAAFKARLDEIVHKYAPATRLVEGDGVTIRAHGRFCHEVQGLYMVELDNGLRVEVRPDMLVRRRKGDG